MGYPSPFSANLQVLNGMGMGIGVGMMGNGGLHSQQHRFSGGGDGGGGQQDQQQHGYLDSDPMTIWSNTPTGFE